MMLFLKLEDKGFMNDKIWPRNEDLLYSRDGTKWLLLLLV